MREFAVADPALKATEGAFLEASAGTGKTFAIEHLVQRIVLEGVPLDRILVMTFTKAATRELTSRIRKNLEAGIAGIKNGSGPAYLHALPSRALQLLEDALLQFEEAKVMTIHSFCMQMLKEHVFESGMGFAGGRQVAFSKEAQGRVVHDFFMLESAKRAISPAQAERLINQSGGGGAEGLFNRLTKSARWSGESDRNCLATALKALSERVPAQAITNAFHRLAPHHLGLCDRSGAIKDEPLRSMERFATVLERAKDNFWEENTLLDDLIRDGVPLLDHVANGTPKKGYFLTDNDKFILELLKKELEPALLNARDPSRIEERLQVKVKELMDVAMAREESFSHDGLLEQMQTAVKSQHFLRAVRARFDIVVVDEFQDTDPVQWEILKALFHDACPMVLVGDPKQSIYAFRRADVYSYLEARELFDEQKRYSLSYNYRSAPSLVTGLNHLFQSAPLLFALPKRGEILTYQPVVAAVPNDTPHSSDGPIRFVVVEGGGRRFPSDEAEQTLLTHFVQEMVSLHGSLNWSDFTVLVTDRYQGNRVQQFLAKRGIPCQASRGRSFSTSSLLPRMREVAEAAISLGNRGKLKLALIGLLGWSAEEVAALEGEDLARFIEGFSPLRKSLDEDGVVAFFEQLLSLELCPNEKSVAEQLLTQGGAERLHEWNQIASAVATLRPAELIDGLVALEQQVEQSDVQGPLRPLSDKDAVTIQTVFGSKGLEYRIVFALALAYRSPVADFPEEGDAEKGRLLYVALTRAKERVYIPVITDSRGKELDRGTASPVELLLGNPASSYGDLYTRLPLTSFEQVVERLPGFAVERASLFEPAVLGVNPATPQIHPPYEIDLRCRESRVTSFSGQRQETSSENSLHLTSPRPAEGRLPAGAEVGVLLHELLEALPLRELRGLRRSSDLLPFIEGKLAHSGYMPFGQEIAELLWSAVTTSLDGFSLIDVDPSKVIREMEFLSPGYVTGVIDLFCEHQGKIYLVDWKSHWLDMYTPDRLQQVVEAGGYELQGELYTRALQRYLQLTDTRPFEEIFGGAYLVFLRGGVAWRL